MADGRDLARGDPRRGSGAGGLLHRRNTLPREGMEIGIDGIAMNAQQARDRLGIESGCVEENSFRSSALPRLQRFFKNAVDLAKLHGPRFGNSQGTRHGCASLPRWYNHFNKNYVTFFHKNYVTLRLTVTTSKSSP
jgi:hypothetical protein